MRYWLLFAAIVASGFWGTASVALAQPVPPMLWSRTYGGANTQHGFAMRETPDGGYVLAGQGCFNAEDDWDAYVVKTDSLGDTVWTRAYGGPEWDWAYDIQVVPQGGYVIVGPTRSFGAGFDDVYLVRINEAGDTLWTRTYGGADSDQGYAVWPTGAGGYVIAGYTFSPSTGQQPYVVKTDSTGDTLWTRTYGNGRAEAVRELPDKGFVIAVQSDSGPRAIRTDSTGEVIWTRVYGDEGYGTEFRAVEIAPDSGYLFVGLWDSFPSYRTIYVVRTSSTGDTLWTRHYWPIGVPSWQWWTWAEDVKVCPAGGYVLGGTLQIDDGWIWSKVYALRIAENGDTLWSRWYDEYGIDDEGCAIASTADGGYAISGTARVGGYTYDMYLIKTGPDALPVWERTLAVPADVTLEVYPNPFNATAVLRFTLPRAGSVRLLVCDLLGRKVLDENLGRLPAGEHGQTLDASDLPSGIYFARLEALGLERVQKMVIVR